MSAILPLVNEITPATNKISVNTNMANKKWGVKREWPSISARVPPELKKELLQKLPNEGDISKLLLALVEKYLKGQILGVKIV